VAQKSKTQILINDDLAASGRRTPEPEWQQLSLSGKSSRLKEIKPAGGG